MFLPAQKLPAGTPAPALEHRARATVSVLRRPAWTKAAVPRSPPGAAPQELRTSPGTCSHPLPPSPTAEWGTGPWGPSPAVRCPCCHPNTPGRGAPTEPPAAPDAIQRARGRLHGPQRAPHSPSLSPASGRSPTWHGARWLRNLVQAMFIFNVTVLQR